MVEPKLVIDAAFGQIFQTEKMHHLLCDTNYTKFVMTSVY